MELSKFMKYGTGLFANRWVRVRNVLIPVFKANTKVIFARKSMKDKDIDSLSSTSLDPFIVLYLANKRRQC